MPPCAAADLYRVAPRGDASHVAQQPKTDHAACELLEDDGKHLAADSERKDMGLKTMCYRASIIGASFDAGPRDQGGTVVRCVAPRGLEEEYEQYEQ